MKVIVGVKTHMGWAATATIAMRRNKPVVLRTDVIQTGIDVETTEPYHLAAGYDGFRRVAPPDHPDKVVAAGLRKQARLTRRSVEKLLGGLAGTNYAVTDAVVLTGRGKLATSLDKVLASHALIHVAEGLAVRESVSQAFTALGLRVHALDEKSLPQLAETRLGQDEASAFRLLSGARENFAGEWKKEQKTCALAAWLAVS